MKKKYTVIDTETSSHDNFEGYKGGDPGSRIGTPPKDMGFDPGPSCKCIHKSCELYEKGGFCGSLNNIMCEEIPQQFRGYNEAPDEAPEKTQRICKEIERKFKVHQDKLSELCCGLPIDITQGYLLNTPGKVVRVRLSDFSRGYSLGFITVKGGNTGSSRSEFEYEIPVSEAREMLGTLCSNVLKKTRYEIPYKNKVWELDFFKDLDLILVEVELEHEDEVIEIPEWVGEEVTDDPQYYNSNIIKLIAEKRCT